MTRIDFHFNVDDPLDYGCRLARKIVRAGERAVFWCADAARLDDWDRRLWTFSPLDFVPHVRADDPLAPDTPIVLTGAAIERPDRPLLVSLGGAPAPGAADDGRPPNFSRFERLIELVSADPDDRAAARERWRFYRDRGYPIHTHEVGRGAGPGSADGR